MRSYSEHLRVPAAYWILGEISAVTLASTAWAGFDLIVAIACYVVFCGGTAAVLLAWSHTTIEVSDGAIVRARALLAKAPAEVVDKIRARQKLAGEEVERITNRLGSLG